MPSTQAVHPRSDVKVGAADCPCPAGQVAHAAQLSIAVVLALALALNVPEAQGSHTRSSEAVPAVMVYAPAAQTAE